MPDVRREKRAWYLFLVGWLAAAAIVTVIMVGALTDSVAAMARFVGPGSLTVTLPAGESQVFSEQRSIVAGKVHETGGVTFSCTMDGVRLDPVDEASNYTLRSYKGEAVYKLETPRAGTYVLTCTGASPFVVAVGKGVDLFVVLRMLPFYLGLCIVFLLYVKRRRRRLGS